MKLFKKIRKGFTLIELVVVIAVIAILSAVSIVSYVSITNKAKQSNDQQKVDQVNVSLASLEATSGQPNTMYEAVKAVESDGFKPENFKEEAKNYKFAYAMSENRFVIVEKLNKVVYPKDLTDLKVNANLWLFSDKTELPGEEVKFSHYLRQDNLSGSVACAAGLDVGDNTGITSIAYSSGVGQEVVIRSNSMACDISINGAADTVKHYGDAQSVNIIAVAPTDSYHEFGSVPFVEITSGRIVLEKTGLIEAIHLNGSGVILVNKTEENPSITATTAGTTYKADSETKTVAEASDKEEVKEETISNSELVFQVNGSWAEVASYAKFLMQDYVAKVYNKTAIMTEQRKYSPEEIYSLFPNVRDYFVEVGDIHINVDKVIINGVELSSTSNFNLSVGSSRHIRANYYKIVDNKFYLAAPVAAFELMTSGSLIINKTTVALGDAIENTLSVLSLKTHTGGVTFTPHTADAYTYDIDRSQLGGLASWSASYHSRDLSISFNEVTNGTNGIYVTRSLYTRSDGACTISYGTSTIDTTVDGFGVRSYVSSSAETVNWKYSIWFTGFDKVCTLNLNLN